ncbi:MAG: peptidyl-prolyl cis-trans isomerase, partial [Actinomycetota bacterium]|nr:peptidyl-prolyl cis-trans isomerase [Actinomycetota bacterium]
MARYATLVTSMGDIKVKLLDDTAPKTVENFVGLATGTKEWSTRFGEKKNEPLYSGTVFHRVIPDFMIQ